MQDKLFYLRSRHGNTGTNLMFHNKNGAGYGTNLDNLKLYTLEEAQSELNHDVASLPLLKSEVDRVSIRAVDHQHLSKIANTEIDPCDKYVIQVGRVWNGNDIAFAAIGDITFNYSKAEVFSLNSAKKYAEVLRNSTIWPVTCLDRIARRTFQEENINTRKMITEPGLIYKKPRKPRITTGKTRGNCKVCGKITWTSNPYEADNCISCI